MHKKKNKRNINSRLERNKKTYNKTEVLNKKVYVVLFISLGFNFLFFNNCFMPQNVVSAKEEVKEVIKVPDNYLFLGDSITEYYDLDKYYPDLPVVNSGIAGDTTEDILNDMEGRVYQYNPSKIFL